MVKFEDYKYEELDFDAITKEYETLIEEFKNSKTANEQIQTMYKIEKINVRVSTMASLVSIRYTQNVNDKYYAAQQEIMDEKIPLLQVSFNKLNHAINDSNFKEELTKEFGKRYVNDAINALKIFDEKIVPDMIEENKLCSAYGKLIGSAKVNFRGEELNLAKLGKYMTDIDRDTRKEASEVYYKYFEDHINELDDIYDKLVHLRDSIAKKLGFENFIDFRYLQLGRSDYNSKDVKKYRDAIYQYVVPVTQKLFERQQKRIGIDSMYYYDYNLEFKTGNPRPIGTPEELINKAGTMYKEMSKETDEFFTFMRESNLLDLVARDGKQSGGYTTTIAAYKAPFIFSNFNGTSGDVDVLTHEAGHAFMAFRCKDAKLTDYIWPTLEACEIHSMSMEFFAYPWMNYFFGDNQVDKYKFAHLSGAVTFLPYGVAIDEFQEYVYANPNISPKERRAKWREIEKKYLPHINYGDNKFLEEGGRFFRQSHVIQSPFYYIDYTIAQVCAFQFFNLMNKDKKDAWDRYVNLCNLGGQDTFLGLLANPSVRLVNPFVEGTIQNTIKPIQEYLDKFDDMNM